MNINELDEQANAHAGLTSWQCNVPADEIIELIAAYREAVVVIKGSPCMCFAGCEICDNWPTNEQALTTAKRLGVE